MSLPGRGKVFEALVLYALAVFAAVLALFFLFCPRADAQATPESVWRPKTIAVQSPLAYATAPITAATNNLPALQAAVAALPTAGGIVWFGCNPTNVGQVWRKDDVLLITKHHVKLWAQPGCATLFENSNNVPDKTAVVFRNNVGSGVFGLTITSNATSNGSLPADSALFFDNSDQLEVEGNNISGARTTGIFLYGTDGSYVSGNYIHHTYKDHIHHTNGSQNSWVWGNRFFNETYGDDAIACVTYGLAGVRCGAMEWFENVVTKGGGGRGFTTIGGENILIRRNWTFGTFGAGILIASEGAPWNSPASANITIDENHIYAGAEGVPSHTNILISGNNPGAAAIGPVTLTNNTAYGAAAGSYRTEGSFSGVTNAGLIVSEVGGPPEPPPTAINAGAVGMLRTRDTSFITNPVLAASVYRIHLRPTVYGDHEQRYEMLVKGEPARVAAWCTWAVASGAYVSERRVVGTTSYALVLGPEPRALTSGVTAVTWTELRAGDRDGSLAWLWDRVETSTY
jgi:parallel beta-helix repeat protein